VCNTERNVRQCTDIYKYDQAEGGQQENGRIGDGKDDRQITLRTATTTAEREFITFNNHGADIATARFCASLSLSASD
jgi:hypothetical protein